MQILGVSPPSTSTDRSPSVRAAIGSVSSSVRFSHGLSGRRAALDRRKGLRCWNRGIEPADSGRQAVGIPCAFSPDRRFSDTLDRIASLGDPGTAVHDCLRYSLTVRCRTLNGSTRQDSLTHP